MNEYEKIIGLVEKGQDKELLELINTYAGDLKKALHKDEHDKEDYDKMYDLSMKMEKIAAIFSNYAKKSKERYLFNAGYLAALVEEYGVLLDKLERISEYEDICNTVLRKAHRQKIIDILYQEDTVQNKELVRKLNLNKANLLTPIMHELQECDCVVEYSYSKFKFYSLTWRFRKYLDSIGKRKGTVHVRTVVHVSPKELRGLEYSLYKYSMLKQYDESEFEILESAETGWKWRDINIRLPKESESKYFDLILENRRIKNNIRKLGDFCSDELGDILGDTKIQGLNELYCFSEQSQFADKEYV